jgi:glucose/arabinose dehydrogenase
LYTNITEGKQFNRLARFDLSSGDAMAAGKSELRLFDIRRPMTQMHNGGDVLFDNRGMLCYSIGDHAVTNTQKIHDTFASGILRIDVDRRGGDVSSPIRKRPRAGTSDHYFIPKDNPWYGVEGALEEFYAIGLRNPFRMSLDRETGLFWVGDIGADNWEEHSVLGKGDNAQWDYKEGLADTGLPLPDKIIGNERPPYFVYEQTALDRAAIGGFIYRGDRHPDLFGRYVFADNNSSVVRVIDADSASPQPTSLAKGDLLGQQGITSLTETPDGHVLVTFLGSKDHNNGRLMVLTRQAMLEPTVADASGHPSLQSVQAKYAMVCARCHGDDGKGMPGIAEAQSLAPRPDFTSPEWQEQNGDQFIRDIILKGGVALGKSPHMPAWEGFLSDTETDLMVQLIRDYGAGAGAVVTAPSD